MDPVPVRDILAMSVVPSPKPVAELEAFLKRVDFASQVKTWAEKSNAGLAQHSVVVVQASAPSSAGKRTVTSSVGRSDD